MGKPSLIGILTVHALDVVLFHHVNQGSASPGDDLIDIGSEGVTSLQIEVTSYYGGPSQGCGVADTGYHLSNVVINDIFLSGIFLLSIIADQSYGAHIAFQLNCYHLTLVLSRFNKSSSTLKFIIN